MKKSNLKTILEAVRGLIMKNRVAYKDYLGEETVDEVICEGVCTGNNTALAIKKSEMFQLNKTYQVTIDGATSDWVAKVLDDEIYIGPLADYVLEHDEDPSDPTGMWAIISFSNKSSVIHLLIVMDPSLVNKTFVVSQSVTRKKYNIKKLPEELLPDSTVKAVKKSHTHNNKDLLDTLSWDDYDYWNEKSNFSGDYNDLQNKPTLFDGKYSSLTGKPSLLIYAKQSDLSNYIKESDLSKFVISELNNMIVPYCHYQNNSITEFHSFCFSVGQYAFCEASELTSVILPNVQEIDGYAFAYCEKLNYVSCIDLPNTPYLKIIGIDAFHGDANLTTVHLPDTLETILSYAFAECSKLSLTKLPPNLSTINNEAFQNCLGLTTLTFSSKPQIHSSAFEGCTNLTTINVPWAEGEVANAPWGATNATINYNYVEPTTEETT